MKELYSAKNIIREIVLQSTAKQGSLPLYMFGIVILRIIMVYVLIFYLERDNLSPNGTDIGVLICDLVV